MLLKMNIFYYLPSIPLLFFSSLCDQWLDDTFGDALTALTACNTSSKAMSMGTLIVCSASPS